MTCGCKSLGLTEVERLPLPPATQAHADGKGTSPIFILRSPRELPGRPSPLASPF